MNLNNHLHTTTLLLLGLLLPMNLVAQAVRRVHRGIIIVENDSLARAMEPFAPVAGRGEAYADVVNAYASRLPDTRVYCMTIPTAVTFYLPDTLSAWSGNERQGIGNIYSHLKPVVTAIDLIPVLADHTSEDIYFRTDHHWAPLGAYYAAETFAREAGVPFLPLADYDTCTVNNFIGTMKRFSRDQAVGRVPETFTYYKPRTVDYNSSRVRYPYAGRRRHKTLKAHPREDCEFFRQYEDGRPQAYSTFMGGDMNTTSISTSVKNGRRLLILKDSYGNALTSFLFGSFEEIHVVDCRYFTQNIIRFARENRITDVLFANNLLHAYTPATHQTLRRYMNLK